MRLGTLGKWTLRFILTIILCCLIGILYVISKILFFSDISERYIPQESVFPGTYLVSYADRHKIFFLNQQALAYSAIKQNIKFILNYDKKDLDIDFVDKNRKVLDVATGAGGWLWKPYVILKTLKQVPENTLVIYADSGIMLLKNINELLALADTHQMLLPYYDYEGVTSGDITARSILRKTNCDSLECRKAPRIWAGFAIFKNTPKVRAFIEKWLEYCEHYDMVIDPPTDPEFPNYHENNWHVHDETLLGIVNYQMPFGQHLFSIQKLCTEYIWNQHRHPEYNKYKQSSVLPGYLLRLNQLRACEQKLYNLPFMIKFRHKLFVKNNYDTPLEKDNF